MSLDFPTLLWMQLFATLTSGAVLLSASGARAPAGLREAMLATVCLSGAYALLLVRDVAPALVSILGANPMFWLSAALIHRALGRYVGRARPARWTFGAVAFAASAFATLTVLGAPFGLRALLSSALLGALLIACCAELARAGGLRREPARRIAFAILALGALGLVARVGVLLPNWAMPTRPPVTDLQIALAHVPGMLVAQGFGLAFLLMHHQRAAARAAEEAATDALTGCANRRALEAQVRIELAHAARKGRACALVVVDLDHFKRVNDVHGHAAGDAALVAAARALRDGVRPGDVVARYGGEEFCVLLREADVAAAARTAERLRGALHALRFEAHGVPVPLRASFGVAASAPGAGETWERLFRRADGALYRAKQQGRDRVVADGVAA